MFCRDSIGGMLSDLLSPRSVGHPAGTAVVRTCVGDRKVDIYMFHAPSTYMPPTGIVAMAYDTYVYFNVFSFRRKVESTTYERDQFSRQRPPRQLIQTIMLRQDAWPPESCWVAEWVSCGLQGQHAFHSSCTCCLNRSRTEGPREIF